ncbi:MAG: hypothetical protein Q9181_001240 [Wetmoreana brouardii]
MDLQIVKAKLQITNGKVYSITSQTRPRIVSFELKVGTQQAPCAAVPDTTIPVLPPPWRALIFCALCREFYPHAIITTIPRSTIDQKSPKLVGTDLSHPWDPLLYSRKHVSPEKNIVEPGQLASSSIRHVVTDKLIIQPAKTTPNAAASTAAVQAFLNNRASNANLSSAAAAAALRSRPTTPTSVGDLPTKRRAQRSGSVSSNGSARPTLQRQGSTGSMTDRTFRDPSPKRGNSVNLYTDEPPPVPALPKGYVSPPPVPAKSLRRPASVEPPERVTSPVPRAGGRGVSLDRGPGAAQVKRTKPSTLSTLGEADRSQNRESINFSRPLSPPVSPSTSPLKAKSAIDQSSPQTPAANIGALRAGKAEILQHAVQDSATRPAKKKKKAAAKEVGEGSHLAGGGAKPPGTALKTPEKLPASADSTPSPTGPPSAIASATNSSQPAPKKKKKRVIPSESSHGSYASDSDSAMSDRSSSTDRPRAFKTRAAGLLAKQPSIVREDREAEEQEQGGPVKQVDSKDRRITEQPLPVARKKPAMTKQHKESANQPPTLSTNIDSEPLDVPGLSASAPTASDTRGLSTQQPRPKSLSPGRAAHFLAQPLYETPDGVKHQPPARSVSPAKSALKHSPSSRGASPVGSAAGGFGRLPGAAGSEASDNGSVISDDGGKLRPKKKSTRVSFDEDSVVVGRASTPPATDSPTILSPQHKDSTSKGFLGFGRRRKAGGSPDDPDQDDGIKPTPILPSFGSIRARNRGENGYVPHKVDDKSVVQRPLLETQTSSDQAIGHAISQDLASQRDASAKHASNPHMSDDPLPPEVTSVEGTGYHSDNEESAHSDVEGVSVPEAAVSDAPGTIDPAGDKPAKMQNGLVPSIAILPATPGIGSTEDEQEAWPTMPGTYRASTDDEGLTNAVAERDVDSTSSAPIAEHHATDPTPANLGIAEPEPESTTTSRAGSPIVGHVAESIQHQTEVSNGEESDDSGNSIYSDAAEDVADLEGDGFGSINAIIESPVIPATPFVAALMPESPSIQAQTHSSSSKVVRPDPVKRNESELSEPSPEEGWDRAQAYWSGLSQSRKDQLERAAIPGAVDEPTDKSKAAPAADEKPKKKKMVKKTPSSTDPPLPPWPDKDFRREVTRPSSPNAGKMKQSMRSSQPEGPQTHMRASMRDDAPPKSTLPSSNPVPETKPAARKGPRKADRPLSAVNPLDHDKMNGKPAANHGRAASVGVTPKNVTPVSSSPPKKVIKPALRRATSDGSDSSSSFKKARRPSTSGGDRYTMKRTMRAGSDDSRPQSAYANRTASLSARSASPPGRRPFSSVGPGGSGMRTSMRKSMDSSLESRTKSPTRGFGFGRKSQPKPAAAPKKTGSRFSSRFEDSSDEDEARPKRHSRFVDSSDEEDKETGLTPVRGIPRRIDEGDSTDLEDSSASPSPKIQANNEKDRLPMSLVNNKPIEGSALATGSLRAGTSANQTAEKEKKKRSFFGGLGSTKKQQQPPPTNITFLPASTSHPLEANHASPIATPTSPKTPKAAKFLGNSAAVASSPISSQATASPNSLKKPPKLQRRNTPKRLASDSWPLPEMPEMPEMPATKAERARPSTSDGAAGGKTALAAGTMRPDAGARRFTAEGNTNGVAVGAAGGGKEKEGKKRRFPMLRKALGLSERKG